MHKFIHRQKKWMDEWMNGQMGGGIDEQVERETAKQMTGWMGRRLDG